LGTKIVPVAGGKEVYILMEYGGRTLVSMMQERQQQGRKFTESEVSLPLFFGKYSQFCMKIEFFTYG